MLQVSLATLEAKSVLKSQVARLFERLANAQPITVNDDTQGCVCLLPTDMNLMIIYFHLWRVDVHGTSAMAGALRTLLHEEIAAVEDSNVLCWAPTSGDISCNAFATDRPATHGSDGLFSVCAAARN